MPDFPGTMLSYRSNGGVPITMLPKIRQIIRYRATATLRRPQNKQYSASKWGGGSKPTVTSYNFDKV